SEDGLEEWYEPVQRASDLSLDRRHQEAERAGAMSPLIDRALHLKDRVMHRLLLRREGYGFGPRLARRERADVTAARTTDHRGEAVQRLGAADKANATFVVLRLADRHRQRLIFGRRRKHDPAPIGRGSAAKMVKRPALPGGLPCTDCGNRGVDLTIRRS